MSKSSTKLNAGFLPILVLIGLIIGAGALLVGGDLKLPGSDNKLNVTRLENFPTEILTTQVFEKQRLVIKSQEELDKFLASLDPATKPLTVKEGVNFDKEYVIAVTSKTLDVDGHRIKIKKVMGDEANNKLVVVSEFSEPGDTCLPETAQNIVVDMIKIKKTDKTIEFELTKKKEEC